ncbi:MAG: 2,3-bisphosphoglycerate-independent phosphoglycerate mutase [Clostridium sp.]|nr:2,3-bisphosphoglycerate-independent phosphoglycerate mutase [Clostridium sp.]MCM1444140.1 2,3-bisphosphoglycerate-independent phosphoglycerate mutase [Candidatus Amulumruptor caecigallinarius]
MKPVVLCILDGVGERKEVHGNAVKLANTPTIDYLLNNYPHSLLNASGTYVGLPDNQMGNSEVGHLNIGAGRVVYQPLQFITKSIENKTFFNNENLLEVINHVKKNKSKLHICGLLSDGGIHSHISHLYAILDMCKQENIQNIYLHMFTDGRDTYPRYAFNFFDELDKKLKDLGIGKIATISGRYYAMDRDNNYDRIKKAYDVMVLGSGNKYKDYKNLINENYNKEIDDEFIIPGVLDDNGLIESNDGIIVFNYRPDRLRELFSSLTNPNFNGFNTKKLDNIKLVTMMPVSNEVICKNAFGIQTLNNTLGEYISGLGLKQLRIAETEKFAHVTYFFDGGEDKQLKNCDRVLIPSPKVATYDMKPEMSAYEITDTLLQKIKDYDLVILNYANGDMVGHTGNLEASINAMQVLDKCLKKLLDKVKELDCNLLIIADHGNCEYMLDENNNRLTTHTTSLVNCILCNKNYRLKNGSLCDVAPTVLKLMGIDIPKEMTGNTLI